jgi:hypothetical protein
MATQYREDSYAVCPFYRKSSSLDIRCEGIIGMHLTSDFSTTQSRAQFMQDFCDNFGFSRCPLYHSIMRKYDSTPPVT